jgi:hypothetical protein
LIASVHFKDLSILLIKIEKLTSLNFSQNACSEFSDELQRCN